MIDINSKTDEIEDQFVEEYNSSIEEVPYFSVEEMILGMQCPDNIPEITDYNDIRGI